MELHERIKAAREAAHKTQADLARACGISRASVSSWEQGSVSNLKNEHLFTVAKLLNVSPYWLATGKEDASFGNQAGNQKPDSNLEWAGGLSTWDSGTPLHEDEVEVPLFREVELAAGAGRTEVIENHGAKLRFAKSSLRRAGVDKENAGCAFVSGNSMEPILPHGSTIAIDKGTTSISDGEMYAIDHGGMLRVKFIYRIPGGGIKLKSQNEAEHPPEEYTAEEAADQIRIIGRVFWFASFR